MEEHEVTSPATEFENNNNDFREDRDKNIISYKLRSGEVRKFDVSKESCDEFGFYYGERIKVRKGEGDIPNLYVHIDGDKGASYYSGYKKEDFIREGFELASPRTVQECKSVYNAPHLKKLLDEPSFSDISFRVGNETIQGHKNILISRNDYFRAMFTIGMRENTEKTIPIEDIDATTFREVLEFIYTGKIDIDENNIVHLIAASQRFQIPDLKDHCYLSFDKVVNEQNVLQILLVADSSNEANLKALCKKYILEHYEIVKSTDFKNLIREENRDLVLEIISELSPPSKPAKKKRKILSDDKAKV